MSAARQPAGEPATDWLEQIKWDERGLVPVIAQDASTGMVLMLAWMNREALTQTAADGQATYFSRSRGRLWRKGEESGHFQQVKEVRLDCDNDVVLLKVEQKSSIACHTGRARCFYQKLEGGRWLATEAPVKDPLTIYK